MESNLVKLEGVWYITASNPKYSTGDLIYIARERERLIMITLENHIKDISTAQ